jgi:hypothetical protein
VSKHQKVNIAQYPGELPYEDGSDGTGLTDKGETDHGWGVLEAQCRYDQPGFERFSNFNTLWVVLVPTWGESDTIYLVASLPENAKVRLITRSDAPITTHTNAQLGPTPGTLPTAALACWQSGPFHHHC